MRRRVSAAGLLLTTRAAPIMLGLPALQTQPAVQQAFDQFFLWGLFLRGSADVLCFVALVWALSNLRRCQGSEHRASRPRRKRRNTMIVHPNEQGDLRARWFSRRECLLAAAGAAAVAASPRQAQAAEPTVDHTIRIGPVSLELAPGKTIKTTGYNGSVPGPMLRLREGRPVNIKVINDAGYPNLVHWHGLYLPALQDGATEEGSPIIPMGNR